MNIIQEEFSSMGFNMNLGAFEFMKLKKKNNKDEMFALGFITAMRGSYEMFARLNGIPEDEVQDVVNGALGIHEVLTIWDELQESLELDLRDPEVVGVVRYQEENE